MVQLMDFDLSIYSWSFGIFRNDFIWIAQILQIKNVLSEQHRYLSVILLALEPCLIHKFY